MDLQPDSNYNQLKKKILLLITRMLIKLVTSRWFNLKMTPCQKCAPKVRGVEYISNKNSTFFF